MAATAAIAIVARVRDALRGFTQVGDSAKRMERKVKRSTAGASKSVNVFSTVLKVAASRAALMAAGIGAAIPAAANVVSALAPLSGALIALPALAGAAGAALGTFKLAVSGVGDAIGAGFSGDAAEFQKAMENLPAPAQRFVKSIVALKPAFDALKKSVAGNFFKPIQDQIAPLATKIMPLLQAGLPRIATSLGNMGRQFAIAAGSSQALGGIKAVLDNTSTGLDGASRAVQPLVKAFGTLASVGAPMIERLGNAVGNLGERFGAFIENAGKTGQLAGWLEGAVSAAKTLGGIFKNVGSILGSVFGSMTDNGGGLLGVLKDLTGQVSDFLKSAEGSAALKSVFEGLAGIGDGLKTALGGVLPALGEALQIIAPSLGDAARAVGKLIKAIAPVLKPVAELARILLEGLAPAVGWLADQITKYVAPALETFATWLGKIKVPKIDLSGFTIPPGLMDFVNIAKDGVSGIGTAFQGLMDVVGPILSELGEFARTTFEQLLPKIQPILDNLKIIFADAFELIKVVIERVTGVITFIWTNFGDTIKNYISGVLDGIVQIFGGVFEIIKGIFETIIGVLTGDWGRAWDGVKDIVSGAWGVIKGIFTLIANAVKGMIGVAKGVLIAGWNAIKSATATAWNAVWNAIKTAVTNAVNFVKELPGKVKGAVTGAATWLVSAGRDLIQGLINGAQAMVGSLLGKIGDIAQGAIDKAKSIFRIGSPSKVFAEIGRFIGLGFIIGLTGTQSKILSTAKSLMTKVAKVGNSKKKSALVTLLNKDTNALLALAKKRAALPKTVAEANKRLQDLVKSRADVVSSVADGIRGVFSLVNDAAEDGVVSMNGILARSARAVQKATQFANNLIALRKAGLNPSMIQELAAAGVTAGGATAVALLKGTPAQIKALNANYAAIAKVATSAGNTVAGALYDSGIAAAKGLVAGLAKQKSAIEKQMLVIAKAMQNAIKKALGIHSPSTVMRKLGEQTMAGYNLGMRSSTLDFSKLTSVPSYAGASARGGSTTVINNNVTVEVPVGSDKMAVAKEIDDLLSERKATVTGKLGFES